MKIRISTTGRSAVLDIENQEVAEAVFNRLTVMLFGLAAENKKKLPQKALALQKPKREDDLETVRKEQSVAVDQQEKAYRGFMYLKCPECGTVKGFNSTKEIKGYHCFECGADTDFGDGLKELYVNCECGKRFKYMTNMEEPTFDINCVECGNPVAVKWNEKKQIYETIR